MRNLVDEEAYSCALRRGMDMAGLRAFVEAYEAAKLEKQKNAYVDDREPSLPDWKDDTNCKHKAADKQPLPKLPRQRAGYFGDDTHGRAIADLYDVTNQILTYLEALNKRMGEV